VQASAKKSVLLLPGAPCCRHTPTGNHCRSVNDAESMMHACWLWCGAQGCLVSSHAAKHTAKAPKQRQSGKKAGAQRDHWQAHLALQIASTVPSAYAMVVAAAKQLVLRVPTHGCRQVRVSLVLWLRYLELHRVRFACRSVGTRIRSCDLWSNDSSCDLEDLHAVSSLRLFKPHQVY